MKILLTSAEVDPFAKVGGLADVVGSLPKALRAHGMDARILMPHYGFLDVQRFGIKPLFSFTYAHRSGNIEVTLSRADHDGTPVYFVRAPWYFGEERTVYGDWNYDMPRFVFFNQLTIEVIAQLQAREGWLPDVVHANDWHTGFTPFLIADRQKWDESWRGMGSMFSIHNMAYQGDNAGGWCWNHGVPGRDHPELVGRGLSDNMLATAIAYSDIITTVSPRYSIEIQFAHQGYGLHNLLRVRTLDLHGILNGIDTKQWDPATDQTLVSPFNAENFLEQRPINKAQLQRDSNLAVRDDVLVIGLVSRLVWQKGLDLALPAMARLLADQDVQFVGLGAGEPFYADQFYRIGQDFHWKARTFVGFNATIANRIYGGCDLFLMPSHYEPCGIGQMVAMRYGALPLVRETGGLADTVDNYDDADGAHGTGFVFAWEEVDAVYNTLLWAVNTFRERKSAWQNMQRRGMQVDFSWERSAAEYIALYKQIGERHGRTG
jgi:starch synthase